MPYVELVKFGGLALVGILWNVGVWYAGANHVQNQWDLDKAQQIIKVDELNKISSEKTEQNRAYATFIQGEYNAKVDDINKLNADLLDAQRLRKKNILCTNRVPPSGNTGSVTESPAVEAQLSEEFERKLISESLRADKLALYADSAHQFISNLCKTGIAKCQKIIDTQ